MPRYVYIWKHITNGSSLQCRPSLASVGASHPRCVLVPAAPGSVFKGLIAHQYMANTLAEQACYCAMSHCDVYHCAMSHCDVYHCNVYHCDMPPSLPLYVEIASLLLYVSL